jgi:hypothetical protein
MSGTSMRPKASHHRGLTTLNFAEEAKESAVEICGAALRRRACSVSALSGQMISGVMISVMRSWISVRSSYSTSIRKISSSRRWRNWRICSEIFSI